MKAAGVSEMQSMQGALVSPVPLLHGQLQTAYVLHSYALSNYCVRTALKVLSGMGELFTKAYNAHLNKYRIYHNDIG